LMRARGRLRGRLPITSTEGRSRDLSYSPRAF
jgi:hypothetical protein